MDSKGLVLNYIHTSGFCVEGPSAWNLNFRQWEEIGNTDLFLEVFFFPVIVYLTLVQYFGSIPIMDWLLNGHLLNTTEKYWYAFVCS